MYKYFDTTFVNVVAVYGRRLPLAHGVSDIWKMINRSVRKGISIIRGQSESHPRASVSFRSSFADIVLRVDNSWISMIVLVPFVE